MQQDTSSEKRLPQPKGVLSTEENHSKINIEDSTGNIKRKISSLGTPESVDMQKKKTMSLLAKEAKEFNLSAHRPIRESNEPKVVKFEPKSQAKYDDSDEDSMETTFTGKRSKNVLTKEELDTYVHILCVVLTISRSNTDYELSKILEETETIEDFD
jgi:hypothetical protein